VNEFRHNLRGSVAASAAPYGYTLTVWSSGMVSLDQLGRPHLGQVLLFIAGAVGGFLLVEVAAYGSVRVRLIHTAPPLITVLGNAHFAAGGLAVVCVWALDHAAHGRGGWAVSGFAATTVYLLLNAAQTTLATRMEEP
jgi:hypothetical protein